METSWKPATADEGFEIVRRRLFEPLPAEYGQKILRKVGWDGKTPIPASA
jgi:hypothetical protein